MSVEIVRSLLTELAVLAFMASGFLLIIAGAFATTRAWAGRLMLVGVVLAVVAGLITPEWLP